MVPLNDDLVIIESKTRNLLWIVFKSNPNLFLNHLRLLSVEILTVNSSLSRTPRLIAIYWLRHRGEVLENGRQTSRFLIHEMQTHKKANKNDYSVALQTKECDLLIAKVTKLRDENLQIRIDGSEWQLELGRSEWLEQHPFDRWFGSWLLSPGAQSGKRVLRLARLGQGGRRSWSRCRPSRTDRNWIRMRRGCRSNIRWWPRCGWPRAGGGPRKRSDTWDIRGPWLTGTLFGRVRRRMQTVEF